MAKAVGGAEHPRPLDKRVNAEVLRDLASRLEELARAHQAARTAALGDERDLTVAYEQLFVAVVLLIPLGAAATIQRMVG
jgi:hypothetical protein